MEEEVKVEIPEEIQFLYTKLALIRRDLEELDHKRDLLILAQQRVSEMLTERTTKEDE